jgi:DNA-binding transcriptional LysR family regulator
MNQLLSLVDDVKQQSQVIQGEMSFSIPRSLINVELGSVLINLRKKYPLLGFKIKGGVTSDIKKSVINNEVQFGVLLDDHYLQGFQSDVVGYGKFILVARNQKLNIKTNPMVVTDLDKVEVKYAFSNILKKYRINPRIEYQINSWSVIVDLIKKADLIGLVPQFIVKNDIDRGRLFQVHSEIKSFEYEIKVIWPLNRSKPKNAQLFVDELKRQIPIR